MATISSQLTLNDGMSSVLKKITQALNTTLTAFEDVQDASSQAIDVATLNQAQDAIAEANVEIDQMSTGLDQADKEQQNLNKDMDKGTTSAGNLLKKITSMVGAYMSLKTLKNVISDSLDAANTQLEAQTQLQTVIKNSNGTIDDYNTIVDKASEIQSAGMYSDEAMIAAAAEFGTYFDDVDAITMMMDTLTDYATGMEGGVSDLSADEMTQYATNLGKIMTGSYDAMTKKGFEFSEAQKAIIEGTATEEQIVAELGEEYLDCSADMQAAAAITSVIEDDWEGLYDVMSSTPEGQIQSLNNSLGDMKEQIGQGIYPAVMNLVNNIQGYMPQIQTMLNGLIQVLTAIINIIMWIVDGVMQLATMIQSHWNVIGPILWGVAAALAAYVTYIAAARVAETAHNVVTSVSNGLRQVAAKLTHNQAIANKAEKTTKDEETKSTEKLKRSQQELNAAMLASPITWIIAAVIAAIAVFTALARKFDWLGAKSTTVLGTICGLVNVVIQWFKNLGLMVANIALGIGNAISALCGNMHAAFNNVICNIQAWFWNLLSDILTVVEKICTALNALPFINFDYSGIVESADKYAAKAAEALGNIEEYQSISDAFQEGMNTYDAFYDGWKQDAFDAGASFGDSIMEKLTGTDDEEEDDYSSLLDDLTNYDFGDYDDFTSYDLDDIADSTGSIANSASSIADSVSTGTEELSYLRDIAERDAINRFTTAEVRIDMSGMTNRIDNDMDIDGVIRALTDGFTDALATAAEGVSA